jgi:hypothetical protein
MAVASVGFLVLFGLTGLIWGDSKEKTASKYGSVGLGLWSWIVAAIVFAIEFCFGPRTPLIKVRSCSGRLSGMGMEVWG